MRGVTRTTPQPDVSDVNYVVTGDGEHAVVLLHGFSDNLTTWTRIVPRLAVEHRVVAIDLPGFGGTSRHWTSPLLDGYVQVVTEVLDAEGITGPVSLIGNSMGAVVSALFAARHPERADRVVLIDMPGLHHVPRLWRLAMSRPTELGLRAALRVVPNRTAQGGLGWAYSHVAAVDTRRLDPTVLAGFTSPYSLRGSVPRLLPIGRALLAELQVAGLAELVNASVAPVLLVFGSRDLLTPPRVLRHLGRPGGAVVLPGCGHCPQIDRPHELMAHVAPFLRPSHEVFEAAAG